MSSLYAPSSLSGWDDYSTSPWNILVPYNIYHPLVHEAILPALVRGVLGCDEDCMELICTLVKSSIAGIASEADKCGRCSTLGKECIAAAQYTHAWAWPATYAVSRCICCVLAGVPCDLPWRTFTVVCTCDWLMTPADRAMLQRYITISRHKCIETCKPRAERQPFFGEDLLPHLQKWLRKKLAEGIVFRPRRGFLDVMCRLGREPYRDDGRWLIEALGDWSPCACNPYECNPSTHLRYMCHPGHASDGEREQENEDEGESEAENSTDASDVLASASASGERSDLGYDAQDEDSPNNSHTIVNDSDVSLVVNMPRVAEGRCCGLF